jgi:hypothetical protein
MNSLTDFLFPAPAPARPAAIVRWWEGRRLAYNGILGLTGSFSWVVSSIVASMPPNDMGPIPLTAVLAFGVAANVCYCFGPMAELFLRTIFRARLLPPGPTLYRMGLTFSVGLTLLPMLMVGFTTVVRVIGLLIG